MTAPLSVKKQAEMDEVRRRLREVSAIALWAHDQHLTPKERRRQSFLIRKARNRLSDLLKLILVEGYGRLR